MPDNPQPSSPPPPPALSPPPPPDLANNGDGNHRDPNPDDDATTEAVLLKTLADRKYKSGKLKSALKYTKKALRIAPHLPSLSSLVSALQILFTFSKTLTLENTNTTFPDWYRVFEVDPFSDIEAIKEKCEQMVESLDLEKYEHEAIKEAIGVLEEGIWVLRDEGKREEYDEIVRVRLKEEEREREAKREEEERVGTFWTACSRCRLLHEFERKYVGYDVVCPNCNLGFKAVEVEDDHIVEDAEDNGEDGEDEENGEEDGENGIGEEEWESARRSGRIRGMNGGMSRRRSVFSLRRMKRKMSGVEDWEWVERRIVCGLSVWDGEEMGNLVEANLRSGSGSGGERGLVKVVEESRNGRSKRGKVDEELTLAEIQLALKRHAKKDGKEVVLKGQVFGENGIVESMEGGDLVVMPVEDSDFYDFDKDRVEKSFKKGQIWAIYDDDDGMPRHYGLINEVVSVNPFEVRMSWLDLQNNGDERLILWENLGFHVSCGRFKVARKDTINLLNIFSHVVDCERAAKEVYWIYPKKGSVWALYGESCLDIEENGNAHKNNRSYDIVVFLTSYSPMYGLSMAYLEKVGGFKSVFKRRDFGLNSIKWLEKDDFRKFSHLIPARKLSGGEVPDRLKGCWELDPASLPADLLMISYEG